MQLKGKVALVTGAGRGIGKGIALALAREGATVVVSDVHRHLAEDVAHAVEEAGREALAVTLDVSKSDEVTDRVHHVLGTCGQIDVLVNNAGILKLAPVVDMTEADWDAVLAVNLKGAFLCCRAVAPQMIARRSGKIVNISSGAGKRGSAGKAHYVVSKFGLIGLTQCLAAELAPYNVNVNAVCPGIVDTYIWRELLTPYYAALEGLPADEAFDRIVSRIPLGRPQTPEDIGNLVVFLASEKSRNITGQAISVTGNWG
jgi:NAD(P)-dependent dehydrogenase (short-subunit alcohol dehydrogenase family)